MKILYVLLQVFGVLLVIVNPESAGKQDIAQTIFSVLRVAAGLSLIFFGAIRYRREKQKEKPPEAAAAKPVNLKRSAVSALILYIIDAIILNQGGIAVIVILTVIFVFLPEAVSAYRKKEFFRNRLSRAAIFLCMAIVVLVSNSIQNDIARTRADRLIQACNQFKEKYQKYPAKLSDLAPEFIPSIPPAKYTLLSGSFLYSSHDGNASLGYFIFPPFGRRVYFFHTKQWIGMD